MRLIKICIALVVVDVVGLGWFIFFFATHTAGEKYFVLVNDTDQSKPLPVLEEDSNGFINQITYPPIPAHGQTCLYLETRCIVSNGQAWRLPSNFLFDKRYFQIFGHEIAAVLKTYNWSDLKDACPISANGGESYFTQAPPDCGK